MSYVRYGNPSHDPAGLQPVSQIISGTAFPARVDLPLVFTFDTAGTVTRFAKVAQGKDAHYPIEALLESRIRPGLRVFTASVDLGIVIDFSTSGAASTTPRVYRAIEPFTYPDPEPVSRSFQGLPLPVTGAADLGLVFNFDTAGLVTALGAADLGLVFTFDTAGFVTAFGAASDTYVFTFDTHGTPSTPAAPPPIVQRAKEPFDWPDLTPVSRSFQPLPFPVTGAADLGLSFNFDTSGAVQGAVRIGIAQAGKSNQGFMARAPEPFTLETIPLESRGFVYYHAAPPIYRVLSPGQTNQGFQFRAVDPVQPVAVPPSRLVKGYAPVGGGTVFGAADLPIVFNFAADGTLLGSLALPLVFNFGTAGQTIVTGSVTLPLNFNVATAGSYTAFGRVDLPLVFTLAVTFEPTLFGSSTLPLSFIFSTGHAPHEGHETTTTWADLLRESKDPGGDVSIGSNRWLEGPKK